MHDNLLTGNQLVPKDVKKICIIGRPLLMDMKLFCLLYAGMVFVHPESTMSLWGIYCRSFNKLHIFRNLQNYF